MNKIYMKSQLTICLILIFKIRTVNQLVIQRFLYLQNKEKTIEVIVDEELVWLSQKLMAELFGTTRNNITMHLSNIFENELSENSVCKEFLHTARDGKNYNTKYYNLDAIIAVRFKVNSKRAIEFRL